MLHAVLLLVATRQLVLLDATLHVVGYPCGHYESILSAPVHGLGIYVVILLFVLTQPALVLEHPEVLHGLLIDTGVMLVHSRLEIYFGLDDMVQAHRIPGGLGSGFLAVKHVVRTTCHLLHQLTGWTNAFERFYFCHCFVVFSLVLGSVIIRFCYIECIFPDPLRSPP